MSSESTAFVSSVEPTESGIEAEEQSNQGIMVAQIEQEFNDRQILIIENYELDFIFEETGLIRLTLNPDKISSATIFKLNKNNNPFGIQSMTLNLLVHTQEESIELNNVELRGDNTAKLTLSQDLPILSFLLEDEIKSIQILGLSVIVPAELIVSTQGTN